MAAAEGSGSDASLLPATTRDAAVSPIPWYARPVAALCSDANLSAWTFTTLLLLALKVASIAAATDWSLAAGVVVCGLATALPWYYVFVLLGSADHRALYAEAEPHECPSLLIG
jgi:hypothetical protein